MEVVDLLKKLPKEYRDQALYNHEKYYKKLAVTPNSLADALIIGFKWSTTPEGKDYWENVYNIITGKKVPIPERKIISVYVKKKRKNIKEVKKIIVKSKTLKPKKSTFKKKKIQKQIINTGEVIKYKVYPDMETALIDHYRMKNKKLDYDL